MASKNQLKMAERLAKKNAAAVKGIKDVEDAFEKDPQLAEEPKAKRPKIDAIPAKGNPEKKASVKQAPQQKLK
ncbi:hypothetical protein SESBI_37011, partial [Sesbania bispinosa]